jgi:hypothetical protein
MPQVSLSGAERAIVSSVLDGKRTAAIAEERDIGAHCVASNRQRLPKVGHILTSRVARTLHMIDADRRSNAHYGSREVHKDR